MEKLAYSINETARVLSLGRTSIYAMIADKRLDAFKLGRRTLIRAESVRRLVAGEGNARAAGPCPSGQAAPQLQRRPAGGVLRRSQEHRPPLAERGVKAAGRSTPDHVPRHGDPRVSGEPQGQPQAPLPGWHTLLFPLSRTATARARLGRIRRDQRPDGQYPGDVRHMRHANAPTRSKGCTSLDPARSSNPIRGRTATPKGPFRAPPEL